jgi:hypothetical protein
MTCSTNSTKFPGAGPKHGPNPSLSCLLTLTLKELEMWRLAGAKRISHLTARSDFFLGDVDTCMLRLKH